MNRRMLVIASMLGAASLLVSACEDEGPVEEAAEETDEALEDAADAAEDAGEDAGDAAESAGDALEDNTGG